MITLTPSSAAAAELLDTPFKLRNILQQWDAHIVKSKVFFLSLGRFAHVPQKSKKSVLVFGGKEGGILLVCIP